MQLAQNNKKKELDPLAASFNISIAGMDVQNQRLKVIAQNIANIDVTAKTPEGEPYRRKVIFFQNEYDAKLGTEVVKVANIGRDYSDFTKKYQPSHPAADQDGLVKYPNVNMIVETVDSKEAQKTFEANVLMLLKLQKQTSLKF